MKAVSLISIGIDSPVASYLIAQKGVDIIGVNFSTGENETLKKIMAKIGLKTSHVLDMNEFHQSIDSGERMRCILCKRFMYRAAAAIASQEGAAFLITGENIGQVASQTISNMAAIDRSVDIPVIRPLLCYDKEEIISIARKIGTFDLSILRNSRCPYVPLQPATRTTIQKIEAIERGLPLQSLLDKTLANEIHLNTDE